LDSLIGDRVFKLLEEATVDFMNITVDSTIDMGPKLQRNILSESELHNMAVNVFHKDHVISIPAVFNTVGHNLSVNIIIFDDGVV